VRDFGWRLQSNVVALARRLTRLRVEWLYGFFGGSGTPERGTGATATTSKGGARRGLRRSRSEASKRRIRLACAQGLGHHVAEQLARCAAHDEKPPRLQPAMIRSPGASVQKNLPLRMVGPGSAKAGTLIRVSMMASKTFIASSVHPTGFFERQQQGGHPRIRKCRSRGRVHFVAMK